MQSLVSILLFFIVVIPVFVAIIFTYQIRNRPKTLEMGSIGLFLMDILMWGMGTLGCGGCFYLLSHIDYSIQISQYCLAIVVISFLNFCFLGGRKRFRKENWHFYFFAILFFLRMQGFIFGICQHFLYFLPWSGRGSRTCDKSLTAIKNYV